jgi:tetratricopeptide (TPR) repeat protein
VAGCTGVPRQSLEERAGEQAAERLAYHWTYAAGPDAATRAGIWSVAAAHAAVASLGFEQAVAHLRRALDAPGVDRVEVLLRLGEAQRLAGDVTGARSSFVEAARLAEDAGRVADLAAAGLGIGGGVAGFEVPIADTEQVEVLRRALARYEGEADPLRAALLARLSVALTGLGSGLERRRLAEQAMAIAENAGDTGVMSAALAAYCDAVAGPDYVRARLESAERMLALAPDRVSALLARRLRVVALLERGDLSTVDAEIEAYQRVAESAGIALYQWLPAVWRGMRAALAGDVAAALSHAEVAEEIGRRAGSRNAEMLVLTLRMQAHLLAGTAEQLVEPVRQIMAEVVQTRLPPTYSAGGALVLAAAGDLEPGREVLRGFMATPAEDIIQDAEWVEGHWALAEIALRLGDRAAASRLLETLRPYESVWAVDGIGAAVFGTVGHQLGQLAAFLGRQREAVAHLSTALREYQRVGAVLLEQRVRSALAELPGSRSTVESTGPAEVGQIRREGRFWRLRWRERVSTVPDGKGMRDLAVLLAAPGRPIPALDLVATGDAGAVPAEGGLGPVLDPAARRAYRARLAELAQLIAETEADADADPGGEQRLGRLRAEHEAIAAQLGDALGLGGRPRTAGDPAERARKAVTMRIRDALRAIEAVDPTLARHLRNAVKTGRACVYEPDTGVTWRA